MKYIGDPNNYTFKSIDLCLVKGCIKPIEWVIEDGIGLCSSCYNEMASTYEKKDGKK